MRQLLARPAFPRRLVVLMISHEPRGPKMPLSPEESRWGPPSRTRTSGAHPFKSTGLGRGPARQCEDPAPGNMGDEWRSMDSKKAHTGPSSPLSIASNTCLNFS